jgi:predicted MFS family arabinose efflux permease
MNPVRWPAVWILGAGQCVYWGILYYAFSVLLVPMRDELGVSNAVVAGAFSVGLGVSALLATTVGRRLDAGRGTWLLHIGALVGAVLLLAWSTVTTTLALYAVWAGLGACMAAVLYETAFALIARAVNEPAARLKALASVTVMGGLASTVFLPLVGAGVAHFGWRMTLRCLAVVWLLTTWWLHRRALPALHSADAMPLPAATIQSGAAPDRRLIWRVGTPFVVATFAAMALTTLVIPTLVDRGHPIDAAAWVLAALGIMQLPGRVWLWRRGGVALSAHGLLVMPLALQAVGLLLLGLAPNLPIAFIGVATFGIGAGLHTLSRPWIVPQLFGVAATGRVNGAIARAQGVARAAGPFAVAGAYGRWGATPVYIGLALLLAAVVPLAASVALKSQKAGSALAPITK